MRITSSGLQDDLSGLFAEYGNRRRKWQYLVTELEDVFTTDRLGGCRELGELTSVGGSSPNGG